jgi:heme-degrading monooxygenase HmoA
MPQVVTAYQIQAGKLDEYEEFLALRKLAVVRGLPGVVSHEVYRCGQVYEFGSPAPDAPRYDMVALTELEDYERAREGLRSREFQSLREEYAHMLVPQPGVYVARRVDQRGAFSAREYWGAEPPRPEIR